MSEEHTAADAREKSAESGTDTKKPAGGIRRRAIGKAKPAKLAKPAKTAKKLNKPATDPATEDAKNAKAAGASSAATNAQDTGKTLGDGPRSDYDAALLQGGIKGDPNQTLKEPVRPLTQDFHDPNINTRATAAEKLSESSQVMQPDADGVVGYLDRETALQRTRPGEKVRAYWIHNPAHGTDTRYVKDHLDQLQSGTLLRNGMPAGYWQADPTAMEPPVVVRTNFGFEYEGSKL